MATGSCRGMCAALVGGALLAAWVQAAAPRRPPYPEYARGPRAVLNGRGGGRPADTTTGTRLAVELQLLSRQYAVQRGAQAGPPAYSPTELQDRFGIRGAEPNPSVEVAITVSRPSEPETLKKLGAEVRFRLGQTLYASVPVLRLEQIAREPDVRMVRPIMAAHIPELPRSPAPPVFRPPGTSRGSRGAKPSSSFDHRGLTGKGVIVAILDTGIDWRHPDFRRPDGTSRILYLYDPFDDSWSRSAGGSEPPFSVQGRRLGTLYTRQQITAALKGRGKVNSPDLHGHGTACAGVAAASGRATARGVPAGTYAGVAPEADLIAVRVMPEGHTEEIYPYYEAVRWVAETARRLGKPCVISMSLGGHFSAHDGTEAAEQVIDRLVGPGSAGLAVCVAAGNEGNYGFHAGQVFGPRRPGQQDIESEGIQLHVTGATTLTAYFDHGDDWGLAIGGQDRFLVNEAGETVYALLYRDPKAGFSARLSAPAKEPADFDAWLRDYVGAERQSEKTDQLVVVLPPGSYELIGFAASARVKSGRFDLYVPNYHAASFGRGVESRFMVGSPGNAGNVITVASYDFRGSWQNLGGQYTFYNLRPGDLSGYSSPGYRRDGFRKPDITAPAQYAISSLARECKMGKGYGDAHVTRDGLHIAWNGTSAATPYIAGVVALMLQKNPRLNAAQIKRILTRTATRDEFTGATPNPRWGFGKVNPAAALKATPPSRRASEKRRR
jgi:minor extracellular serine protease Vpr